MGDVETPFSGAPQRYPDTSTLISDGRPPNDESYELLFVAPY